MSRCAFVHNARALWATDVERLVGVGCVDDDQVRDSVIYGSAEFIGGIGFDEESIFVTDQKVWIPTKILKKILSEHGLEDRKQRILI